MGGYRYRVSLRIWHPQRDPDTFSAALGLAADHSYIAGQSLTRRGERTDSVSPDSYWLHEFDASGETKDVEKFLSEKADLLSAKKEFFSRNGSDGGRAEFFVGFFPEEPNCAFTISPALHRKLAEVNLGLSFDIYPYIGTEKDDT